MLDRGVNALVFAEGLDSTFFYILYAKLSILDWGSGIYLMHHIELTDYCLILEIST